MKFVTKLALVAAITAALPASAAHTWGNYHWATTSTPVVIDIIDSTTPDWDGNLNDTLSEWNQSNKLSLTITSSNDASNVRKTCKMSAGDIRVCNASYGGTGWLGLASINIDSNSHITQGTAKLNDSYASYWTPEQKNHVMCQEVGHLFGLGHTSEDGSSQGTCMDYSTASNSQWPNSHDMNLLSSIYNHSDSYNTSAMPTFETVTAMLEEAIAKEEVQGAVGTTTGNGNALGHRIYASKSFELWAEAKGKDSLTIHHVYLIGGYDGHEH